MSIWSQGEFYPGLEKKIVELNNVVDPGPSDNLIKIDGFDVYPGKDGHFIEQADGTPYSEDELDAIHTYATIRTVINLFENIFEKPIQWSWWKNGEGDPLIIKIRSNDIHARYIKDQKCIELYNYGPSDKLIHNCRCVDLIAHETAHAILDSIMPHLNAGNVETKGIGEAFCDLAAIFMVLSRKDLCAYVIEETKGDLMQSGILSLFGVGHGDNENQFKEIRNAINNTNYKSDAWSPYDYSQVLIGMLYEILIALFEENRVSTQNDVENLFQSGQYWMKAIVHIFQRCPVPNPGIADFGQQLIQFFDKGSLDIKNLLAKRNIR